MSDRLRRIIAELETEIARTREEDRAELAEWFGGVLQAERDKNTQRVNFVEMMKRGHGLGDADDDEASVGPPAA